VKSFPTGIRRGQKMKSIFRRMGLACEGDFMMQLPIISRDWFLCPCTNFPQQRFFTFPLKHLGLAAVEKD